jgi:HlyD family secretion protein
MQILASVDESDIGQIKDGQPVQFTVQSYPGQSFTGAVEQVRLQSTTTDNVVNYTAVINVQNKDGKLLPGMTATVSFQTAEATNVLTVPNSALRIKPTETMTTEVTGATASGDSTAKVPTDSAAKAKFIAQNRGGNGGSTSGRSGGANGGRQRTGTRPTVGTLWFTDSTGTLHRARVRIGLTDGQRTQVEGKNITEGLQVITSIAGPDAAAPAAPAASPFQTGRGVGGGRRG